MGGGGGSAWRSLLHLALLHLALLHLALLHLALLRLHGRPASRSGLQADYALALGGLDCSDEAELDEASLVAARHERHHERAAQRREAGAREACAPWKAAGSRLIGLCEQPRRRLQA